MFNLEVEVKPTIIIHFMNFDVFICRRPQGEISLFGYLSGLGSNLLKLYLRCTPVSRNKLMKTLIIKLSEWRIFLIVCVKRTGELSVLIVLPISYFLLLWKLKLSILIMN